MMANLKAFLFIDMARAIKRTSGGIGKKELPEKASRKRARELYLVCAQCNTQLYSFLIIFIIYKLILWVNFLLVNANKLFRKKK